MKETEKFITTATTQGVQYAALLNVLYALLVFGKIDTTLGKATGDWLDILGKKLNTNRATLFSAVKDTFHYDLPADGSGYDKGHYDRATFHNLSDEQYRVVLQAVCKLRFRVPSIPNLLAAWRLINPDVEIDSTNAGRCIIKLKNAGNADAITVFSRLALVAAGVRFEVQVV